MSYLVGEQADCLLRGTPTEWLEAASDDFEGFVAVRRGVQVRWDVPSTVFWYVSGEYYLGTLVIRHQLTPELVKVGGHIGYHVVAPWRGRATPPGCWPPGLAQCRDLGLARVLLTCAADNEPSRRVILANGGIPDGQNSRRRPVLDQPRQQPPSISPRPPREPTHQGELLLIRQKAPSWQQVGRVRANARVQAGTSEAAGALT